MDKNSDVKKSDIIWTILFFGIIILSIYGAYERDKKEEVEIREEQLNEAASNLTFYLEELSYSDDEIPYIEVSTIGFSPNSSAYVNVYIRLYDKFDNYSDDKKAVVVHKSNLKIKDLLFTEISKSDYISQGSYTDWYITFYYDTNSESYDEYTYDIVTNSWELIDYCDTSDK